MRTRGAGLSISIPLIAAIVIGVLFFACSKQTKPSPPTNKQSPVIHAFLNNILQDWEGQKDFSAEFEKLTGTKLQITQPPHQNYMERVFLSLSSDMVPDIIEVLPEYLPRLIQTGTIIPLDSFISKSSNLQSVDSRFLDPLRNPDGQLYAFPARDGGGCITYIRQDWLDNLGLPIPETWAELVRVMEAFTFDDPDGNGINDSYGYTDVAAASQDWYNRLIFGEGRVEIYWDEPEGRWVDGLTRPATQAALIRLKELYDRGIIDPAIPTNTTYAARTKFINGQAGIFTYWANHWARNLQDRTEAASSPAARILPLPAPRGVRYIRRIPPVLVISAAATDPAFVFEHMIDRQYDKGPVQTLFTLGVKGIHWDLKDGRISFLPNPLDPFQADYTKAYVPPGSQINDWELPLELDPLVGKALEIFRRNPSEDRQKWGGEFFSQYHQEIEQVLKPDIMSSYLAGDRDLTEAMELYRREAARLYLDEILNELNGS
ncbi:MAG: extracellular solute-binding protein [Spirochaetes bacterium]|nr:extracellular solute-binding protein [Spirochaetota bacterium]MBU0954350.1 extracellular solute-binding protein [Spirochaetota bacterium]